MPQWDLARAAVGQDSLKNLLCDDDLRVSECAARADRGHFPAAEPKSGTFPLFSVVRPSGRADGAVRYGLSGH